MLSSWAIKISVAIEQASASAITTVPKTGDVTKGEIVELEAEVEATKVEDPESELFKPIENEPEEPAWSGKEEPEPVIEGGNLELEDPLSMCK